MSEASTWNPTVLRDQKLAPWVGGGKMGSTHGKKATFFTALLRLAGGPAEVERIAAVRYIRWKM